MRRRRGGLGARLRALLGNLLLALLSLVLGLAAMEGAAWLYQPPPKPGLPPDMLTTVNGLWQMTPNYRGMQDNRVDFRDAVATADADGRRIVPAAPAEAPRKLVVLGDSQSFGHGLSDQDSWPNRLQEDLNRRGVAVKVRNLAVPGINIDQYVDRAKLIEGSLEPGDTVLVGVSWNDIITPAAPDVANALVEGYLVKSASVSPETIEETRSRVRFFKLTGIIVPPLQNVKDFFDALSQSSALVQLLYPRAKAIYYRVRAQSPVANLVKEGVPEANMLMLRGIADLVERRGARLVAVFLPERMFFEDEAYAIYSVNGREYPTQDYMGSLTMPWCERLQMSCLNAFALLHDHHREGLVFRIDGHFNPKGAALLGPWLSSRLFPE